MTQGRDGHSARRSPPVSATAKADARAQGVAALRAALALFLAMTSAARAAEGAANIAEVWRLAVSALAVALAMTLAVIFWLVRQRREAQRAQHQLAELSLAVEARGASHWSDTGVPEVDAIAHSLQDMDERLREKCKRVSELNDLLMKSSTIVSRAGANLQMRALLDAVPVGIIIAEAPSGRIVEGNHVIEAILRRPVRYSESTQAYSEWNAIHQDGRPVANYEYPLARALAGESHPQLECKIERGDGAYIWINIVGAPIRDDKGAVIGAIVAITDIDDIKNTEIHNQMMNRELHHRVNNSLAMIQGIANITARTAQDFSSFQQGFSHRVQCLSRISTLLVQTSWERTPLKDLLMIALSCGSHDYADRISLSGEDVELRSAVASALGLTINELLANAEQHGALSEDDGRIAISWRIDREEDRPRLILNWMEIGGPKVESPEQTGVGHFLITNVLARQMGGDVRLSYQAEGLQAELSAEI
ncbi:PAS domain S-box protein [Methylocystis sp. FS]|uniref:HWE histidine kinase domain-containing protein n=1 Tax=Methylocystis silviterrae TaxID=2743612 RepID=UPI00158372D7|nr:HWE histidine kinase domain-containing protein [Methylocystis silviterrae]NUJ80035.1 PAS domain S-box protein [Methylocystis silviterrae]